MTPLLLKQYLDNLVNNHIKLSVMIWGPLGIGQSSIVALVAEQEELEFVDVRLSQLAPTDLRGLPVADNGKLNGAIFTGANLTGATLKEVHACQMDFNQATFVNAIVQDGQLSRAILTNANLVGAMLQGANLRNV